MVCNTFTLIGFSAIHTNRGSEWSRWTSTFAFTFSLTHSTVLILFYYFTFAATTKTDMGEEKNFHSSLKWNRMFPDRKSIHINTHDGDLPDMLWYWKESFFFGRFRATITNNLPGGEIRRTSWNDWKMFRARFEVRWEVPLAISSRFYCHFNRITSGAS